MFNSQDPIPTVVITIPTIAGVVLVAVGAYTIHRRRKQKMTQEKKLAQERWWYAAEQARDRETEAMEMRQRAEANVMEQMHNPNLPSSRATEAALDPPPPYERQGGVQ